MGKTAAVDFACSAAVVNRWSFGTECQAPCAKSEAGFVSLAAVLLWAYVSRYAGSAVGKTAAVGRSEIVPYQSGMRWVKLPR